ncbi:hypothetical protein M8J77_006225 [Diaphorina citri]|nr:hypothetical protein M8J77_006225 [Diaphorina citri]
MCNMKFQKASQNNVSSISKASRLRLSTIHSHRGLNPGLPSGTQATTPRADTGTHNQPPSFKFSQRNLGEYLKSINFIQNTLEEALGLTCSSKSDVIS